MCPLVYVCVCSFSEALKKHNAITIGDLADVLRGSFQAENKPPVVEILESIPDYKGWFNEIVPKFSNISKSMCFVLKRVGGYVRLFSRQSTHVEQSRSGWFPDEGYPIISIDQGRKIFTSLLPMVPLRDVDVDSISRTILAYKTVGLLTEDHHLAWQEHLRNVTESLATRCDILNSQRHGYFPRFNLTYNLEMDRDEKTTR